MTLAELLRALDAARARVLDAGERNDWASQRAFEAERAALVRAVLKRGGGVNPGELFDARKAASARVEALRGQVTDAASRRAFEEAKAERDALWRKSDEILKGWQDSEKNEGLYAPGAPLDLKAKEILKGWGYSA